MGIEYRKVNKLSHFEKQAVLYFKGHFRTTDMMEDLKVFVAEYYALDKEQVQTYSIYHFVVRIYMKLVNNGLIHIGYEDFILNLFDRESSIDPVGVIKKLSVEIMRTATKDLKLGDADYNLLPKA